MVKITYIWHDCFVAALPSATLVFDYWLDSDGERRTHPGFLEGIDRSKPLLVFVSHFHKDHYNPDIFSWASEFSRIRYFVSLDVWRRMRHIVSPTSVYAGPKVDPGKVTELRPGAEWSGDGLTVKAFPSTDVGNSWLVETDGRRVFHAGDLNAWVWRDESTEQEINKALGDFNACLRDIDKSLRREGDAAETPLIDIAFFPVDSRIGSGYFEGASIFTRKFRVGRFFPMHFGLGDEAERRLRRGDALQFARYANPGFGEYIPLALPGSSFLAAD